MPGPTRGCRAWDPVPGNDELTRNPHAPFGFRRRAGICGVAAPRQWRWHCLRRGAWQLPARRAERDPCYDSDRLQGG